MSTSTGPRAGGRERHIDRAALPDPSLWVKSESPHGRAMRRLVLAAVVLVGFLALSAFAVRGVLGRVGAARRAALPLLEGLPGTPRDQEPEKRPVSPEELAALQKSWVDSQTFAPRGDRVDRTTGERVAPFQGFGLQIDSEPAGARVIVNGEEMGTAPLLTTVDCRPGDEIEVRLVRDAESARAVTRCRVDALVKLQLRLAPGRSPSLHRPP